jgi:glycosyltransferase involved in cell wall biosynthesis
VLVDPLDVAEIAAAVDGTRRASGARGVARAARFNWDETARRTHAVYEEAA